MIRTTIVTHPGAERRVVVEGRITKGSSVELAGAYLEHLAQGNHLALDLSGVTFADSDGVALVRDLVMRGCVLEECSELVRTLVEDGSSLSPKSDCADNESEQELLAQLRAGDEDAFEQVVQRYGGRMLATARRFLNNEHDAQDAVQEAFASAFRALDKFKGDALLTTWLHRIVVNAALVQLHRARQALKTLIERDPLLQSRNLKHAHQSVRDCSSTL
jgi:ABC-type transporter Mla MlaB component